jgi:hypothetical protein
VALNIAMRFDREWIRTLSTADLRVRIRTGGRPTHDYAVILERRLSGLRPRWRAIFLIDNHMDVCHLHRYHGDTKLNAEAFPAGEGLAVNEQLPKAIEHIIEHHDAIFDGWRRRG